MAHMDTVRTRTAAEYRIEMEKVFAHRRHPEKPIRFEGAVLTSVVPQITGALAECARYYTGKKPVIVSPEIRTGLTMGVPDPHAVGKDRLVDAAYAAANFPLPVVTVDLGTATTFNVVDKDRVFRGGVICPGLSTGLRALGERCAQLPQVRLSSPKTAIGVNTESCMLSGSVLGTAVLLDGITQTTLEDGIYSADFETDSSMFRVNETCDGKGKLTVQDGKMTIHISLTSQNIVNLFPGTAEDAQKDGAELLQPTVDTVTYEDGISEEVNGFDVPVPVLDEPFNLALIGTKGKWYDHEVIVSNPEKLE